MSTFKKVEQILINDRNEKYGGKIYNASISFNFGQKPLEAKILFVRNRDEEFEKPELSLTQPIELKINELEIKNLYAYKFTIKKSTQGDILEVSYKDASFVLDKYYVGIQGKHGFTKKYIELLKNRLFYDDKDLNKSIDYEYRLNKYKKNLEEDKVGEVIDPDILKEIKFEQKDNLLLFGKAIHPCDTNNDNFIDPVENGFDRCDPCPHCPDDKYDFTCFETEFTRLFKFVYSFEDLINGLKKVKWSNQAEIKIDEPKINGEIYEKYYRDYHGPLREVLTMWANDFGMIWYFDPEEEKIKFIDFNSKEIEVNPDEILRDYEQDKLISYELEESAENTTQVACISWYEREGERKNFDCSQSQAISLSPLGGADLLGNKLRQANNGDGSVELSVEDDIVGSIYGSYYTPLRDVYWLRDRYRLINANNTSEMITELNLATGFKEDGQPKQENSIAELGDMVILAVVARPNVLINNRKKNKFQELAQFKINSLENSLTDTERAIYELNSGYFIIAYQNQEYYERILERERLLFSFIGRFHVRENLFRLCGITGSEEFVRNNTSIEAADGAAQIYSKREGMDSSPLAQFNILKKGYLDCILGTGNIITKEDFFKDLYRSDPIQGNVPLQGINYELQKSKDYKEGYYNEFLKDANKGYSDHDSPHLGNRGNNIPIKMSQSVIILDRKAQWIPKPDDFEYYRRELANSFFSLLSLKEMGNDGQIASSDWTKAAFGDAKAQIGAAQSGMLGKIKIFLTYPGEFETILTREGVRHPTDRSIYEKKDYENISRRIGGRYGSLTKIGLLSSKCTKIETKINGKKIIPDIFTPPFTFGLKAPNGNKIVEDDLQEEKKPCDKILGKDIERKNRPPSYKVILNQNYNQTVVLPKIQSGVHSGIKAPDEVMNFDINYNAVTNNEFIAFTGYSGYGCIPNLKYLEKINELYSQYAISNTTPDKSLKLEIKDLPKFQGYSDELKKGLDGCSLSISEQGVSCSLSYSTKAARKISNDMLKWKNTVKYYSRRIGQT